jgi:hypothetical protein
MHLLDQVEENISRLNDKRPIEFSQGSCCQTIIAVANVLALPLSQAARILLISSMLSGGDREMHCRFNELAALSGLSERTAYRALKEIKESGLFAITATPGIGVRITAEWLWNNPGEGALKILKKGSGQSISIASPKE